MVEEHDNLSPNGFPLAPDWGWSIRAAVYPGRKIDEGNIDLLNPDPQEVRRNIKRYAERGVNFIQTPGFHLRVMWFSHHKDILRFSKLVTEIAHEFGLHVYEHFSSTFLLGDSSDKPQIERCSYGWNINEAVNVDIRTGQRVPENLTRVLCINNPDFIKHHTAYILNLIEKTGIDGLMYDDMHFYRGQYCCGCQHCREKFENAMGYSLPEIGKWPLDDYKSEIWRDWMRFRNRCTGERITELRKDLPNDFLLLSCMSQGVLGVDDVHHGGGGYESFANGTNCMFCEGGAFSFRNDGYWHHDYFDKWERLYVEKKYLDAVATHFTQPSIDLHYSANQDDGYFCWAMTKLLGHQLWRDGCNAYGGMRYDDEFEQWTPQYDYLNWEAEHEELWKFLEAAAEIGVLHSIQTKLNIGAVLEPHAEAVAGWIQILQRNKIFFNVLIDKDLEDLRFIDRLKVIILPNAVCLSEKQCEVLRQFVAAGGTLIATHKTSLCDENGNERTDFALSDMFGVHVDGQHPAPSRSSIIIDRRWIDEPFAKNLAPRVAVNNPIRITWDGENSQRCALAWMEKTRSSFAWPHVPGIVKTQYSKGTVLYMLPSFGASAYREGPFPIWYAQPHLEKPIEEHGTIIDYEMPVDEKNTQWIYVDKSNSDARKWMKNLVDMVLPNPGISIKDCPENVLCELKRIVSAPGNSDNSDGFLISLLNVTGSRFDDGDKVVTPPDVKFPDLSGTMQIHLTAKTLKNAKLFSPDLSDPINLDIKQINNKQVIELDISLICKIGFVRIYG